MNYNNTKIKALRCTKYTFCQNNDNFLIFETNFCRYILSLYNSSKMKYT